MDGQMNRQMIGEQMNKRSDEWTKGANDMYEWMDK